MALRLATRLVGDEHQAQGASRLVAPLSRHKWARTDADQKSPATRKTVLITGANAGIGKDAARQLGLRDDIGHVYLACRNALTAQAARRELERATGRAIFEVVVVDLFDLASARSVAQRICLPLTAVVMNAGGLGGRTPMALTADGVTELFAANVLGHVALLDELLARDGLIEIALLAGSEAARGIPPLHLPRPAFDESSRSEFSTVIDGSFFKPGTLDLMLAYGQVKYLAALWMAATARKHRGPRFVTTSPGNTVGTGIAHNVAAIPTATRPQSFAVGVDVWHPLEAGAKRYLDAITDPSFRSGGFYASAADRLTGPVIDQAAIMPELSNPSIQDAADSAIRTFLP